jgi:hypothetical protein
VLTASVNLFQDLYPAKVTNTCEVSMKLVVDVASVTLVSLVLAGWLREARARSYSSGIETRPLKAR